MPEHYDNPEGRDDPEHASLMHASADLARSKPGAVLLSGYWDAYAVAALQPGMLIPVPFEGEWLRIPFHLSALRTAPEVLVGHQGFASVSDPALGQNSLRQYGTNLRLLASDFYRDHQRWYSLYAPVEQNINASPAR